MRLLAVALGLTTALLAGASVAPAADIGANDDFAKYQDDYGSAHFREMAALGLRQVVVPVRFRPSEAVVIQDKTQLDAVVPNALDAGLRVVLAVYPYPPRELEAGLGSPSLFGSYVGAVASIYPQVKQFVVGNEPNQPAFWRPQFDAAGANVSAATFGGYLAAAYDSLKAVGKDITVVGVGLSPRGNDRPKAKSNISTSPVRFLRALGAWYRRSGRATPIMDAFSFHPYPNRATDPLERGYGWPNAGFVNLDRLKQALWDAFTGTAQPTPLDGLRLHLDEVGWQVSTARLPGYRGAENVPVTDEVTQAAIYGELVRRAACDPAVAEVNFFGFRDDGLRTGFQAGLLRVDGALRPSAESVRAAIAETAGGCTRRLVSWQPHADVLGARIDVVPAPTKVTARVGAGEDARGALCVRASSSWLIGTPRCQRVAVPGTRPLNVSLPPAWALGTRFEIAVELTAVANAKRRSRVVARPGLR